MAPEFWKRRQVSWVLPTIISAMDGFALKVRYCSSLCNLRVLCVSVVDEFRAKTHHRDTENTEVAQRNPEQGLCAKHTSYPISTPADTPDPPARTPASIDPPTSSETPACPVTPTPAVMPPPTDIPASNEALAPNESPPPMPAPTPAFMSSN